MEKQLTLFEKLDDLCLSCIYGNLECRSYYIMTGKSLDGACEKCGDAAEKGHLECLKYLHENGCPWDENTCIGAASNGHLECLCYARENGMP